MVWTPLLFPNKGCTPTATTFLEWNHVFSQPFLSFLFPKSYFFFTSSFYCSWFSCFSLFPLHFLLFSSSLSLFSSFSLLSLSPSCSFSLPPLHCNYYGNVKSRLQASGHSLLPPFMHPCRRKNGGDEVLICGTFFLLTPLKQMLYCFNITWHL